ncbi:MAG TPA: LysR family transcriptional regulator [Rhizomicrobium sp.]|nr:LysR family transcriptional regulator [Rhizomicrobium sp.]
MELYQVRYFLALSKQLNFTRAAEFCNVTQPALTKAVQKLETELGGELIYRERGLTQLTELGKLVLPMLERMLTAADAVKTSAIGFKRQDVAPIKIGLPPCVSPTLLVGLLSELRDTLPGLQVELIEALPGALPGMLLEGELSAAFAQTLTDLPERLDQWPLLSERYVVLAPEDSPLREHEIIPLDLLAEQTWLDRAGCDVTARFWATHFPDGKRPWISHRGHREEHLHQMVAAGLGVLLSPEHVPCPPRVIARPIEGDPITRDVALLAVAGRRYTPALDALIKACRLRDWGAVLGRGVVVNLEARKSAAKGLQESPPKLAAS